MDLRSFTLPFFSQRGLKRIIFTSLRSNFSEVKSFEDNLEIKSFHSKINKPKENLSKKPSLLENKNIFLKQNHTIFKLVKNRRS